MHAAVLLFGFAGLFGKWLSLPATTIVLGRALIASVVLAALLRVWTGPRRSFDWRLAASGAVLALHWVAFFRAIQVASVAIGLLGYSSFPLFVLILEAVLLRRPPRRVQWLIGLLVTVGLLLLVPEFDLGNRTVQGLLWGLLSGLTFALLALANRALSAHRSAGEIALWQNAVAAICLLPLAIVDAVVPTVRELALLVVLGVFCTALAHTLFIRGMRTLSAHTASVVAALEPVYGIALAAVLLGELPGARTLLGAALIIGAALWSTLHAPESS